MYHVWNTTYLFTYLLNDSQRVNKGMKEWWMDESMNE